MVRDAGQQVTFPATSATPHPHPHSTPLSPPHPPLSLLLLLLISLFHFTPSSSSSLPSLLLILLFHSSSFSSSSSRYTFLISFSRPLLLFTFHFAFIHHMHYPPLPIFIHLDWQCFHPPLLHKYPFIYILSRTLRRRSPSSFSLNGGVDAQRWNLPSLPLQVFPPSSPRYLASLPRVK